MRDFVTALRSSSEVLALTATTPLTVSVGGVVDWRDNGPWAHLIDAVTKQGAGFKSLKDTWADTTSPHGRLMLTVLGGLGGV